MGSELLKYDKAGRIIQVKSWYYKWEKPNLEKEEISLELNGWEIKKSDLENMNFTEADEGEYKIQVNPDGDILNIIPVQFKGGSPQFNQEVYSNFKAIKLLKKDDDAQLNGILKVVMLDQRILIANDLDRVLKPTPRY